MTELLTLCINIFLVIILTAVLDKHEADKTVHKIPTYLAIIKNSKAV